MACKVSEARDLKLKVDWVWPREFQNLATEVNPGDMESSVRLRIH